MQSDDEVCLVHGIQYDTRGVRGVREIADVEEGHSCAVIRAFEDHGTEHFWVLSSQSYFEDAQRAIETTRLEDARIDDLG